MSDLILPREVDEPITIARQQLVGPGGRKLEIQRQYIPPLDGTDDEVQGFDQNVALEVAQALVSEYYGYEWHVVAETRQGIVYFSIPDLMGPTLKAIIRLHEFNDLTPKLVKELAGNLLERMGLRRGPKDEAEYAEAKLRLHTFDFADVKK